MIRTRERRKRELKRTVQRVIVAGKINPIPKKGKGGNVAKQKEEPHFIESWACHWKGKTGFLFCRDHKKRK